MSGKIIDIYIAETGGAPMTGVEQADLVEGKGIVGDRYYAEAGTFSEKLKGLPDFQVTLIESEQIDQFNGNNDLELGYGELRRNIITSGIDLNSLVDLEFTVGEVKMVGIRLCEPCAHLAKVVTSEVLPGLVHKAGLRAAILEGGQIQIHDEIKQVTGK